MVVSNLTNLSIKVVTTHIHWDNIGRHKFFDNISVHGTEADWLNGNLSISSYVVKKNLMRTPCDFLSNFSLETIKSIKASLKIFCMTVIA